MGIKKMSLDSVVRISQKLAYNKLEDEAVIIRPNERKMHLLNPVGCSIWFFIESGEEAGKTINEIIEYVLDEYDVSKEQATSDVFEFIQKLADRELLEIVVK